MYVEIDFKWRLHVEPFTFSKIHQFNKRFGLIGQLITAGPGFDWLFLTEQSLQFF